MKTVCIIGAGQLGSRHLQALKTVRQPLNIIVVDPNQENLKTAQERYESFTAGMFQHSVSYNSEIPVSNKQIDLAIIPTNSNMRKQVIEKLLLKNEVKHMVLEKLLFQRRKDYQTVGDLIKKHNIKTWVNCSMRTMPFYHAIKNELGNKPVFYHVSGSQFGLVTNAIHYLDHISYITDCSGFCIDTGMLDEQIISSKRKGFMELNGTLNAKFADGSHAAFTCYPDGNAPVQVQLMNSDVRIIVRETERKAWISRSKDNWTWIETDAIIPYQSEMTTVFTESILNEGKCVLVNYEDSSKIHLQLLDPLLEFVNKHTDNTYDIYPFT